MEDRVYWLARIIALFDVANERAGLPKYIDRESYLRNPRVGLYMWRKECEAHVLPKIEPEAYREELQDLITAALMDYSWEYIHTDLDDNELQILREEYERYKRVTEADLRR